MQIYHILRSLEKVTGLTNVKLLSKVDIDFIRRNEEKNNTGVLECLNRDFVIMVTHDSSFRAPEGKIVELKNKEPYFPGVGFSEVKGQNVISSSPGPIIHKYLVNKFKLKVSDDATLLVGLDLNNETDYKK